MKILRRFLSTSFGRATFLNVAAEAEDSDDGQMFDAVVALTADHPELVPMIRRHQADEKRHAKLFRECVVRNGGVPYPVPSSMQLFIRMSEATGFIHDLENTEHGVMKAYCLLQVVEERAIKQFEFLAPVLREFDPESADVLDEIAHDEIAHLGYCHKIARLYMPDEETREETVNQFRIIEAKIFAGFKNAVMGLAG